MHREVCALPAESSASVVSVSVQSPGWATGHCALFLCKGPLAWAPATQGSICSLHTVLLALNVFLTISSGTNDLQGLSCPLEEEFDYIYTAKNIKIVLVAFHV